MTPPDAGRVGGPAGDDAPEETDEPALTRAARAGDADAVAVLFARHRAAAVSFAKSLAGPRRAEDLVSEAFERILVQFSRGGGPEHAFRPYLYVTIRHVASRGSPGEGREIPVDDLTDLSVDQEVTRDGEDERAESSVIANAMRSLPERWQFVLWQSTVEEQSFDEIGSHLGIKANAVAALAFRARAGLRRAYLAEHLQVSEPGCAPFLKMLPRYVRGELVPSQAAAVSAHLATCHSCTQAVEDLRAINSHLGALLTPLAGLAVLWGPASGAPVAAGGATSVAHSGALKVAGVVLVGATALGTWALLSRDSEPPATAPPTSVATVSPRPTPVGPPPAPETSVPPTRPATVRPTSDPTTSPTADPTVPPVSPASPTSTPPSTPPSTEPSARPRVDAGFGEPSVKPADDAASSWAVTLPVRTTGTAQTVRLLLSRVRDYRVDIDPGAALWSCLPEARPPAGRVALTCAVAGTAPGAWVDLAFVITPQDGGATLLRARVTPESAVETHAADNSLAVSMGPSAP